MSRLKFDRPCKCKAKLQHSISADWAYVECTRCGAITAKYRDPKKSKEVAKLLFGV